MKLFISIGILVVTMALGLQPASAQKTGVKKDTLTRPSVAWRKLSLDGSIGTRGVGFGLRYHLTDKSLWYVRLGYSYMPISYNFNLPLSGYQTQVSLWNDFQGIQPLVEFRPASDSRFKLIAGFSYFYEAHFNLTLLPTGNYKYGAIPLSLNDVGQVHATIDWKGVAPFIGFGFGSPHPKHKLGCAAGFGVYVLQQPTVIIEGTKFLSGNDANKPWLQNNIKDYRYLPIFNFHINYRFKK